MIIIIIKFGLKPWLIVSLPQIVSALRETLGFPPNLKTILSPVFIFAGADYRNTTVALAGPSGRELIRLPVCILWFIDQNRCCP
jgi:hypothetical protein